MLQTFKLTYLSETAKYLQSHPAAIIKFLPKLNHSHSLRLHVAEHQITINYKLSERPREIILKLHLTRMMGEYC